MTFPGCFCQTVLCLQRAAQVDARCGPLQQSEDSPAVQQSQQQLQTRLWYCLLLML